MVCTFLGFSDFRLATVRFRSSGLKKGDFVFCDPGNCEKIADPAGCRVVPLFHLGDLVHARFVDPELRCKSLESGQLVSLDP
jgi:hypothetical protein